GSAGTPPAATHAAPRPSKGASTSPSEPPPRLVAPATPALEREASGGRRGWIADRLQVRRAIKRARRGLCPASEPPPKTGCAGGAGARTLNFGARLDCGLAARFRTCA